ncbi:unnamed protein product [Caenorhabditis bovis]|uniref:N-acetylglucosamine-6-phosphate deacetylase n=1 Tax=Caenorhabditis bovis TaxID=2654633 RepID=A0A8S1EMN7_9PELO|nr:unnamed protein product [Caenorhabditis bovis]
MLNIRYDSPALDEIDIDGKLVQLFNCRILQNDSLKFNHLWIRDGKILSEEDIFFGEKKHADVQIDCCGLILSPGFIDVQLNGGFGVDFSTYNSNDVEYSQNLAHVAKNLLAHGVTSFAPTVITSAPSIYHKILPLLKPTNASDVGAGILGAHLEGPFISKEKRGCHPPHLVVSSFGSQPVKVIQETYGCTKNVAIVTLAPELEGAREAIKTLAERGVVVSVGHSSSNLEHGETAVNNGARMITHLFNAMQSYHHRNPGLIGLLTSEKIESKIHYGIISDGIHTHDSALRIAYRTNPEGMILVTDAIAALGMHDGVHRLGEQTIIVNGLHAILDGTNTTAGSVASMPYCIRHLIKATGCSIKDALICATEKPARLLGIDNEKGVLGVGRLADFVLIDDDINVKSTFCSGKRVFLDRLNE